MTDNTVVEKWLADGYTYVGKELPQQVESNPGSFQCGFLVGYKEALLRLTWALETKEEMPE